MLENVVVRSSKQMAFYKRSLSKSPRPHTDGIGFSPLIGAFHFSFRPMAIQTRKKMSWVTLPSCVKKVSNQSHTG